MNEKRRIIALIIILAVSITVIASVTIFLLYRAAFEGQKARLAETAQSQARMMEAVARDELHRDHGPDIGYESALMLIFDAHSRFEGFGETGEFTLAERDGNEIVFLLSHRHSGSELSHRHRGFEDAGIEHPLSRPILFNSDIAEPMRRALSGESGIIVGLDYRGVKVLAAHEPVDVLNLGIVAKIDLAEIRAPFIKAGFLAAAIGLVIILIGTFLFLRISDPMIRRLEESEQRLRYALEGAQDGVWDWNIKTGKMILSERWVSMLGYELDEIEPKFSTAEKLCHPDDISRVTKAINDHLEKKTLFYTVELRMKAKSGAWKWILSRGRVMERDTRGKPLRMIGTHHDITERKMAEEALRLQSEIAVNMSEGVYLVRASDGIIVYTNPKFEKIFGYGPGEMIGKHASIANYPTQKRPEETATDLIKLLDEHGAWNGEIRNIKKDGTPFWSYASVSMFDHPDYGKVLVAVHTDITDRKHAEEGLKESEERFRTSVENMLDCFGMYSAVRDDKGQIIDFKIEYVNRAACGSNLMSKKEQIGRRLLELLPAHRESGLFDEYCAIVETGKPFAKESLTYEDGYTGGRLARAFDIRAVKLGDGFLAAWRDVTDRARAQAEREKLIAELEMKKAEMERFNYTISHELKSPLITIRGFIGLLEKDIGLKDMERARADGARIAEAAGNLQQLIDELLELSRAGRVIGDEEEVSLGDIARQAIELVAAQIKKHRVEVEVSPDLPVVRGDPVRLREVFQNLVENAAKFMGDQPGPHIEIGVRNDTPEPVFYVRDNGMGIDTKYHSRVFDIFEQLDQEFDGTGVGLALVKRIVERHGGSIWAESEGIGKGASFCFTLPGVLSQVTKMNGNKGEGTCNSNL